MRWRLVHEVNKIEWILLIKECSGDIHRIAKRCGGRLPSQCLRRILELGLSDELRKARDQVK